MSYRGHVRNGVVVLDEPVGLPDGAEVRIELPAQPATPGTDTGPAFWDRYEKFVGCLNGLPSDAAERHDHYLYGTPKQ
jgi:hypothetical protein